MDNMFLLSTVQLRVWNKFIRRDVEELFNKKGASKGL